MDAQTRQQPGAVPIREEQFRLQRGVGWDSSKLTHKAGIYVNGHDRHLGMFDTVEEARPSHAIWTAPFPRRTVRPEGQDLHAVMLGSVLRLRYSTRAGQSDSDQLKRSLAPVKITA